MCGSDKRSSSDDEMDEGGRDMKKTTIKNLTLSAMFMALGIVLPFLTGQIEQIGKMLLPMHIPVFLCTFICGWRYGLTVGLLLPLLRSLIFGMPVFFPNAVSMALELAVYGAVAGAMYERSRWQCLIALYRSMLAAMILGRAVWGMAQFVLLGLSGSMFTWQMFIAGALLNAIPGIALQLLSVPLIMVALNRTGLVRFKKPQKMEASSVES